VSGQETFLEVAEVLEKAAARLSPEGAWTWGMDAKNDRGQFVPPDSRWACAWCITGALAKEAGGCTVYRWALRLFCEIQNLRVAETPSDGAYSGEQEIAAWNDVRGRRKLDVLRALRKAALAARQRGEEPLCLASLSA